VTVSSRAFQILYRNEVVKLSDVTVFRLHAIVDANKVNTDVCLPYISGRSNASRKQPVYSVY
jgi:hypothetical protein